MEKQLHYRDHLLSIETKQHQQTQERLERVTIENMALKAKLQEAIDIIKELQQWTRPFAQLPLPQSDDAQSAAATPTKDAVTPDIKGAKRKAATSVEGQPRQGKAARRLTSTFGDSARAGTGGLPAVDLGYGLVCSGLS